MTEPHVKVGILSAPTIDFALKGGYRVDGFAAEGQQDGESAEEGKKGTAVKTFEEEVCTDLLETTATAKAGKVCWNGSLFDEIRLSPTSSRSVFTLHNVVIGKQFHWQREEDQTFPCELQIIAEGDRLTAINRLPIETYLTSVIASEMNANSPAELLKAHAIIARSWLVAQKDIRPHNRYDVCADDHCQRYQGLTRISNPNAQKAIEATRGMVLYHSGKVCDTRYSKCCGGVTEEYEACWEDRHVPYLESVRDPYCNTRSPRILSLVLNNYDQETTDFYRWTQKYTHEELSRLVKANTGHDLGLVTELRPLQRGKSGRIVRLQIVGTNGTMEIGKELAIRRTLSTSHLYSSAFEVEKTATHFLLHGAGWGHGVGLCQIGAAVMADRGFTYGQILKHYYKDVEIRDLDY